MADDTTKLEVDAEAGKHAEVLKSDLEITKLQLEIDSLRSVLAEAKRIPLRAVISTAATTLLGLATLLLGIAGLVFNATIDHAAQEQRRFDDYSKLTEGFAKEGPPRVGAVVGLSRYLSNDQLAPQTAALLANDYWSEDNAAVRDAITTALSHGGMASLAEVRSVEVAARSRIRTAYYNFILESAMVDEGRQPKFNYTSWRAKNDFRMPSRANAAIADELSSRGFRNVDDSKRATVGDFENVWSAEAADYRRLAFRSPRPEKWLKEMANAAPAMSSSEVALSALLSQGVLPTKDRSLANVVAFSVNVRDSDLSDFTVAGSELDGDAAGADFTLVNFREAQIGLSLGPSSRHRTSLCGAGLMGATIENLETLARYGTTTSLPDLYGADWWDVAGLSSSSMALLQRLYPRAEQQAISTLPLTEIRKRCAARRQADDDVIRRTARTPRPLTS